MGAIGVALLGLIFFKVVLILLGALLYATGPLMIGLVPTRFGHTLARAWLSAVMFLLAVGVGWATIFAVGALLIEDSGTAGPLIAGHSDFGQLIGGLILAVTGLVALWLCLKVARERPDRCCACSWAECCRSGPCEATARAPPARPQPRRMQTTGASMRNYRESACRGSQGAGGELAAAVPGGAQARIALAGAGRVGRRGLIGSAAAGGRSLAGAAATPAAAIIGRSRAGAVAVNMAKAGTAAYSQRRSPSATAPVNSTTEASPAATAQRPPILARRAEPAPPLGHALMDRRPSAGRRPRKPRGASAAANGGQRTDRVDARRDWDRQQRRRARQPDTRAPSTPRPGAGRDTGQ